MEKRISFIQFSSIRSIAKAVDPYLRQKSKIENQIAGLDEEFKVKAEELLEKLKAKIKADMAAKKEKLEAELEKVNNQISVTEAGVVSMFGFHATDVIKKVMEPNAKGVKETKYIPTDIVSYDTTTKEYVVTLPDEEEALPATTVVSEEVLASADVAETPEPSNDSNEQPSETQANNLPWE